MQQSPQRHGQVITWIKDHATQITAVIIWGALILFARQYMQANDLTFLELANQLATLLTDTWYGALIYIGIYLLRPLILFPASWLTILAGFVFGLGWGFLYGLIAGTLSAAIPYAMGRWFAGDEPRKSADERDNRITRFFGMMRRNPFQAVLLMRLLFLPYDGVSLVAGGLRIPFIPFAFATFIGNLGGTFAFVGFGASIEGDITNGDISFNPAIFAVSIAIFIVSLAISRFLRQRDDVPVDSEAERSGQRKTNVERTATSRNE